MEYFDWIAIVLGIVLVASGIRAVRRRQAHVPERYEGRKAVALGWLWIGLGTLFLAAVIFDISFLKSLFRLFLEAAN